MITPEEWSEWLLHPVTKAFHSWCHEYRERLKEDWAHGAFTTETVDGSAQASARVIGQAMMLQEIRSVELSQINQGKLDE